METACPQAVGFSFLLMILILLMILQENAGPPVKIRSTIMSRSRRKRASARSKPEVDLCE